MSENSTKDVNTNASPTAYGWVFQVGAGITLMLENMKKFTFLKMEGAFDDIEIYFEDGKIYAQAKSVIQIGDQRSASTNLRNALRLLTTDATQGDALKLIYITNIINPVSSKMKDAYQYEQSYEYSILPLEDQEKIKNHVGEGFPLDKFQIQILNFFGEGDNKFKFVKDKISEFLREAIGDPSYNKKLLDTWFETFMVNCSDIPDEKKSVNLSKKSIIMSIIILVIDTPINEDEFSRVSDYDDYYEIAQEFRNVINHQTCDYEFMAMVMGDYLYKRSLEIVTSGYKYKYVTDEWGQYEKYFECVKDDAKREALIKLVLLTIITRRAKIDSIRKAVSL